MKIRLWLLYACFLLADDELKGQTYALHFTKSQYKAGTQTWAIQQDADDIMYFANNEGLLTFNGVTWEVFPLPNQTIVRSIAFGKNQRLYAGGQDELGYYTADKSGKLVFHSLLPLIDSLHRQFADIWNTVIFGDEVFFRSFSHIFRLHGKKITTYPAPLKWEYLGLYNNRLVAFDRQKGMVIFNSKGWDKLDELNKLPAEAGITAVIPFGNSSLFSTLNKGLFRISDNGPVPFLLYGNQAIENEQYTCALPVEQGEWLLGTYNQGIFHMDSTGRVLETISIKNGLGNNNIKCLYKDKRGNVWAGLEEGIACINLNRQVKWLNPPPFNGSPGYAVTRAGDKLIFALSNGIFEMPESKTGDYRTANAGLKKMAGGLSWNVQNIQGNIFAGRDDGFFRLKPNNLEPVDPSAGFWTFQALNNDKNNLVFAGGNYHGVSLFRQQNGTITKVKDIVSLNTSSRFLEYEPDLNVLWVSHPYRGLYKIPLSAQTIRLYHEKDGLPSALNNHIFKSSTGLLVATEKGIYEFQPLTDSFKASSHFSRILPGISIRYLKEDGAGNLWFVSGKKLGVVEHATQKVYYFPELFRKINSGFEHIYPLDSNRVFIGGDQGFYLIDLNKYIKNKPQPVVFIRKVTTTYKKDSVLFGGYGLFNKPESQVKYRLSSKWNSFHFEFSAPFDGENLHDEYSYRLRNFDEDWIKWSDKTQKDYTNIPPGDYVFEVKVRNNLLRESLVATYPFEIMYPWHQTVWAKLSFLILSMGILYALLRKQRKRIQQKQEKKLLQERKMFEEQQKLQAYRHQLELEKSEKALMQLKNEKLESELASSAMNIVQKQEFLLRIRDEINKLKKAENTNIETTDLKKILRSITEEDRLDEEWDQFSLHFNKVHNNFLLNLRSKYPNLKAHDLKLCAYLRMNLSSKEMARLMSISLRGVEINRYRLRKKLQLKPKEDLYQFLLGLDEDTQGKG